MKKEKKKNQAEEEADYEKGEAGHEKGTRSKSTRKTLGSLDSASLSNWPYVGVGCGGSNSHPMLSHYRGIVFEEKRFRL